MAGLSHKRPFDIVETGVKTAKESRNQCYGLVHNKSFVITGAEVDLEKGLNRCLVSFKNRHGGIHKNIGFTLTKRIAIELRNELDAAIQQMEDQDPKFILVKEVNTGRVVWQNPGIAALAKKLGSTNGNLFKFTGLAPELMDDME